MDKPDIANKPAYQRNAINYQTLGRRMADSPITVAEIAFHCGCSHTLAHQILNGTVTNPKVSVHKGLIFLAEIYQLAVPYDND